MPESSRDEIAKLEALYANNPGGRVFTHLAEAYRKAGELDRARAILEDGLVKHASYASAHVVLGRVLMGLEQDDEAVATFRRVLELDPHNLIALRSLGDLSRAAGRNDEALHYFEELRQQDPNNEGIAEVIAELRAAPARTFEPSAEPDDYQDAPPDFQPDVEEQLAEPASETEFAIEHGYGTDPEPELTSDTQAYAGSQATDSLETEDPSPGFEAAEPEPEPEPEPASTPEPAPEPESASAPPPELAPGPDMFAQHIDLDWVPSDDEEGLPGDLAELAGFSAAPPGLDEPQVPTFALPETDDFSFLNAGEEEADEGPVFEDVSLEVFTEPSSDDEPAFEGEIELNVIDAPQVDEPAEEAPAVWSNPPEEESGELVTETIAELYRSQGLHDRAADVYRTLLRERPGDADLEAKLYEAESLARGEVPQHEATAKPAADPFELEAPSFEPAAPEAIEPEVPDPAEAWLAGAAGMAASAPTPYAWTEVPQEPNDPEPPIGEYFRNLLSWRPASSASSAPEAPKAPEAQAAPEAAFEAPGYDLEAEDEIVFSDAPAVEDEDVLELLEQSQPPEETREIPPLTAATVVEPDAMPWEDPAAPDAVEAVTPEPEPEPMASNASNSEEAFDEWFGPTGDAGDAPQAPEPVADPGELEGEDDDDLEMFRSWLQSLKK